VHPSSDALPNVLKWVAMLSGIAAIVTMFVPHLDLFPSGCLFVAYGYSSAYYYLLSGRRGWTPVVLIVTRTVMGVAVILRVLTVIWPGQSGRARGQARSICPDQRTSSTGLGRRQVARPPGGHTGPALARKPPGLVEMDHVRVQTPSGRLGVQGPPGSLFDAVVRSGQVRQFSASRSRRASDLPTTGAARTRRSPRPRHTDLAIPSEPC
jgi:hypothetical protein